MINVRVPATTANIGPGFDSFGIALTKYNSINIDKCERGLFITNSNNNEYVPSGENNLIYKAVTRVFDEVGYERCGLRINQNSEIPMTRGLGSSSACIVGGLLAGNALSGRKLPMQRIFELATQMEGHPDNVCPALFGGFCVCIQDGDKLIKKSIKVLSDIKFVAFIPDYYMVTKKSRGLLPPKIDLSDASYNISHAAMVALAFTTGDFSNFDVFCKDKLHQKRRSRVIEDMDRVFEISQNNGSLGMYLSDSGPTIVSVVDKENTVFTDKMREQFDKFGIKRSIVPLEVDNVGAVLWET